MLEQKVKIINKLGLHLRAAALLVETASAFESSVHVSKGHMEVDAKSIMGVLGLEAAMGTEIVIRVDGSDEEKAMRIIAGLVEAKFNEEE